MAAHITSTSDLGAPVNFVLFQTFLRRANQALIYLAATQPGHINRGDGSLSVKWRRYDQEAPSTTTLSEKTGNVSFPVRTANTPDMTNVTATIAKYGAFFLLNEEVDVVNPRGYDDELMGVLGEMAGRSLNRLARDEMEDNATQLRVGGVSADSSIVQPLTLNALKGGVKVLAKNSALTFTPMATGDSNYATSPIRRGYFLFSHTDVAADIEAMAGFKGIETYAGQTRVYPGEIGYVNRTRVFETEEASIGTNTGGAAATNGLITTGGTSADLYETLIVGMNAVGSVGLDGNHPDSASYAADRHPTIEMIVHGRGSSGVADPLNDLNSMGYKFWAKFKITNSTWIRRVTSGATLHQ